MVVGALNNNQHIAGFCLALAEAESIGGVNVPCALTLWWQPLKSPNRQIAPFGEGDREKS